MVWVINSALNEIPSPSLLMKNSDAKPITIIGIDNGDSRNAMTALAQPVRERAR